MFLKAGAVSLALLLASRLLGLLRESAQAAAFGASGMADVAVLMLTLPDLLAGLLAGGAMSYALVPAWAGQGAAQVDASQRRVALWLLAVGGVLAAVLIVLRQPVAGWLAGGLAPPLLRLSADALVWSALALPAALLASLWATRLQHGLDFLGLYGANLVVNLALIGTIVLVALQPLPGGTVPWLGLGLLAAMGLRLAWMWRRQRRLAAPRPLPGQASASASAAPLPAAQVWLWAALGAGLPLLLPFAARSIASRQGEGALATFSYAWKLVELPLLMAIQLVAALAFPAIARALAGRAAGPHADADADADADAADAVRSAFALAWTLACAAAAGLLVGAPALSELLFGWGRMDPAALGRVAQWGAVAAWGLLPQALIAVALTVLAAQSRMRAAVAAYLLALAALLAAAAWGVSEGAALMRLLNALFAGVAAVTLAALGAPVLRWLPWRAMGIALIGLLLVAGVARGGLLPPAALGLLGGLAAALGAAWLVAGTVWLGSEALRQALRR